MTLCCSSRYRTEEGALVQLPMVPDPAQCPLSPCSAFNKTRCIASANKNRPPCGALLTVAAVRRRGRTPELSYAPLPSPTTVTCSGSCSRCHPWRWCTAVCRSSTASGERTRTAEKERMKCNEISIWKFLLVHAQADIRSCFSTTPWNEQNRDIAKKDW